MYYHHFLRHLHHAFNGCAEAISFSHAGHAPTIPNPTGRLWSLTQQIEHLQDFLLEHILLPGKPPVIVMGHSIGAYMAIKAVNRLELELAGKGVLGTSLPPIIKVSRGGAQKDILRVF